MYLTACRRFGKITAEKLDDERGCGTDLYQSRSFFGVVLVICLKILLKFAVLL